MTTKILKDDLIDALFGKTSTSFAMGSIYALLSQALFALGEFSYALSTFLFIVGTLAVLIMALLKAGVLARNLVVQTVRKALDPNAKDSVKPALPPVERFTLEEMKHAGQDHLKAVIAGAAAGTFLLMLIGVPNGLYNGYDWIQLIGIIVTPILVAPHLFVFLSPIIQVALVELRYKGKDETTKKYNEDTVHWILTEDLSLSAATILAYREMPRDVIRGVKKEAIYNMNKNKED